MKKFNFNLESVLNHRRLLEEREQQKLMKINQAILQAQQDKEKTRDEVEDCRRLIIQFQKGVIDIDKVRHLANYIQKLELDVIRITLHISKLEKEKTRQLENLVEARKRREVVDKLKEKRQALYDREVRELEQKLQDELSVVHFRHDEMQELPN